MEQRHSVRAGLLILGGAVWLVWIAATVAGWTSPPWPGEDYHFGHGQERAVQAYSARVERVFGAGHEWMTGTNHGQTAPTSSYFRGYLNLVVAKAETKAILDSPNYYWLDSEAADTNGRFPPGTNGLLLTFPRLVASNVIIRANLPTNFWSFTPRFGAATHSNGWPGVTAVLARMTWTLHDLPMVSRTNTQIGDWRGDGWSTNSAAEAIYMAQTNWHHSATDSAWSGSHGYWIVGDNSWGTTSAVPGATGGTDCVWAEGGSGGSNEAEAAYWANWYRVHYPSVECADCGDYATTVDCQEVSPGVWYCIERAVVAADIDCSYFDEDDWLDIIDNAQYWAILRRASQTFGNTNLGTNVTSDREIYVALSDAWRGKVAEGSTTNAVEWEDGSMWTGRSYRLWSDLGTSADGAVIVENEYFLTGKMPYDDIGQPTGVGTNAWSLHDGAIIMKWDFNFK